MFSNRTFQLAFLVSFTLHLVVVSQSAGFLFFDSTQKPYKVEVNYIKPLNEERLPLRKSTPSRSEPLLNLSSRLTMEKRTPPPFLEKSEISKIENRPIRSGPTFDKPALIKPDIIAIKKKIILPPVDLAKIDNPSYINYYQLVREKIRRAAYQNYNRNETGEVYITFVISDVGYLKDARLVEAKSSPSLYLQETALSSVRSASPFPSFPKELDYPQLSFNVVISFEIE